MANEKNLIPWNKRTESEQREYAKMGGQKSGEVRRQRKAMREQMELLLSLPAKNEEHRAFMQELGIDEDNMDNQMMLIMSLYSKALKGDLESFREIKNIVNECASINDKNTSSLSESIQKAYENRKSD